MSTSMDSYISQTFLCHVNHPADVVDVGRDGRPGAAQDDVELFMQMHLMNVSDWTQCVIVSLD